MQYCYKWVYTNMATFLKILQGGILLKIYLAGAQLIAIWIFVALRGKDIPIEISGRCKLNMELRIIGRIRSMEDMKPSRSIEAMSSTSLLIYQTYVGTGLSLACDRRFYSSKSSLIPLILNMSSSCRSTETMSCPFPKYIAYG